MSAIAARLGPRGWRLRRLSRFRWIAKARLADGMAGLRREPAAWLRYVVASPELESHSFDLGNVDELVAQTAEVLGHPAEHVRRFCEEALADPVLSARRRPTLLRRSRTPVGNRLLWYVLVRALRPALVVECGIYTGLGSLVLLRALAANRAEGAPGRLLSVDSFAGAGELVPAALHGEWERRIGLSTVEVEAGLAGRRIGMLIQDTPHTVENASQEFAIALAHADDPLILIDCSGGYCPVLQDLCAERGVAYHRFLERPTGHPLPQTGTGYALL